jgi:hypothetical protein
VGRGEGADGAVVWVGASEEDEGKVDCDGCFVGAGVHVFVGFGLGVRVGFGVGEGFTDLVGVGRAVTVGLGVGDGLDLAVGLGVGDGLDLAVGLGLGDGFGDLAAFDVFFLSSESLRAARPVPTAAEVANASQNGIFMVLASSHR